MRFRSVILTLLLLPPLCVQAAPVITTTSPLTGCVLGTAYTSTLAASGGTAPYSFSLAGGALPTGLSLSQGGTITGTPSVAGSFSFSVTVTDAVSGVAAQAFTMQSFLQMSANGIGMPSPTDATTYAVADNGSTVQVPSGFVYIPRGSFTYGTGATAASYTLDGYCMGRFEVTNAEYKAFLTATGSTSYPSYWTGGDYPSGRGNHPLLFVSLVQANAYAAWVSAQTGWTVVVPNAYQWEKAARGPSAYLYPWGNTLGSSYTNGVLTSKSNNSAVVTSYYLNNYGSLPATYSNPLSNHYNQTVTVGTIAAYDTSDVATPLAVTSSGAVNGYVNHTTYTGFIYTDVFDALNNGGGFTTPAGSYSAGVSAYGAYDVAGNAYEWTTTTFIASNGAEAGQLVNEVRGGGWYSNGTSGQSIDTGEGRSASGGYNSVGFRLAMLPPGYGASFVITTTTPLTSGMMASSYSLQFASSGGNGIPSWVVSSGVLPAGISLSTDGLLSGVPTQAGTFTFTVQALDVVGTATTKACTLVIAAANVLDHFTWDYITPGISAGSNFAVMISARDSTGALVPSYNGSASLSGVDNSTSAGSSPVVITEVTDENEDQIEIQNVSGSAMNTTGWYLRIGDAGAGSGGDTVANLNTVNSTQFALPSSMAAGMPLRITETSGNANNAAGIYYFGGSIAWQSTPGTSRGWVALFDSTSTLRDFFIFNWSAATFSSLSVTINGTAVTAANCGWSGSPVASGTRVVASTSDSWQRQGSSDTNKPADWVWKHNSDSTNATSFGTTNTGLSIPWIFSTPLALTPAAVTFANGVFVGNISAAASSSKATLTAASGAFSGTSGSLVIGTALTSSAGDGIPDTWKTANGFSTGSSLASLDPDGDGASNLQEYLAGTNPLSSASKFAITSSTPPAAGSFTVSWPGVAGKIYLVRTSSDLISWTAVSGNLLCTSAGSMSFTLSSSASARLFARIEIIP